jgi:two-component system chemotaxis response regulator CheB
MIKLLITEDSPVIRGYLEYLFNSDPDIEVVGTAKNGEEAVKMSALLSPDVITMDIHMPLKDGYQATREIMENNPVPIVIISASYNPEEVDKTFKTMEAGAVAALEKPQGMGHPDAEDSVQELLRTVKTMSGVKVVRRWTRNRRLPTIRETEDSPPSKQSPDFDIDPSSQEYQLIAIGASTGGPIVLSTILSGLTNSIPVPIVIVQHIAKGFLPGMCEWLSKCTGMNVHIAKDGEKVKPGKVYLAPDSVQMGVSSNGKVKLNDGPTKYTLCPSVSYLFRSTVESYGKHMIGVLCTGMGRDGVDELKLIKDSGGVTIVQDKKSSIVFGMPGEAIKIGAETFVLPADKISGKLKGLVMAEKEDKVLC